MAMYFVGLYGFIADVTKPEERAHRLARIDGFEAIGYFIGNFLSPIILESLGYFGSFASQVLVHISCILILLLIIKETDKARSNTSTDKNESRNCSYLMVPLKEMKEAVFSKRERNMRLLVLLNFGIYALFRFALNEQAFFYVFNTHRDAN